MQRFAHLCQDQGCFQVQTKFLSIPVILMSLAIIACAQEPQIITNEVTREIPVTVETLQTIEVTRQVPVTVETERQTEVTRIVETTREIPVTRLVEIIQAAATSSPTPTASAAASPTPPTSASASATPEPVVTPTRAVAEPPTPTAMPPSTPTPAVEQETDPRFVSWQPIPLTRIGEVNIARFENVAREWKAGISNPVLTYECDSRHRRALHIDWDFPISTSPSDRTLYDPFQIYRDDDLDALADMTGQMLRFINEGKFYRSEAGKLDEIWKTLKRRWQLEPENADDLIRRIEERSHSSVVILSAFYTYRKDHEASLRFGPTWIEEISSTWVVLPGHRTQMDSGDVGNLRRIYRNVDSSVPFTSDTERLLVITVKEPEQVTPITAEWEISGMDKVIQHCASIREQY